MSSLPEDASCHAPSQPRARPGAPRVVVVGNPNAGKSTLFNAITGGSAQVGNFAGTTVSSTSGKATLPGGLEVELVDVPGTFSLAATSPDERVAIDALLGLGRAPRAPDAVLLVIDGPRLLRSLYLVLQVLELGVPAVIAVNLMDEARGEGLDVRLDAVSEALGVPVVGTVGRSGEGVDALLAALARTLDDPRPTAGPVRFSPDLEADVVEVAAELPPELAPREDAAGALARWVVLSADVEGRVPGVAAPIDAVVRVRARAAATGRDLDAELVSARYAWIDARHEAFLGRAPTRAITLTERIDRVVLHPILGSALFATVMGLAFTALFSWADPLIGAVEDLFGMAGSAVAYAFDRLALALPAAAGGLEIARDLAVDGIIGGVGAVLVFLPQIALLFLLLALLEDCGYLSRAAHLADRVLRFAGLPGRAFVPLLSGYACAVPAIMATRTMPRYRDRLLTMLVIPLTSCSARLPVYTLIIAALFPTTIAGFVPLRPLALAGMYLFSTALAVVASLVLGNTLLRDGSEPVLLELPPYRLPNLRVVLNVVRARCTDFVREAGGIILVTTVVLWGLLYFPRYEPDSSMPEEAVAEARLEHSFGGQIGRAIEPVIEPLGYDWRMGIGLLGAFAAREVFVTTLGVVYGIGDDADEESAALRDRLREDRRPDGTPTYTPLVGLSLMVFFAIALQCLSTLAVLRKESGGWRWPLLVLTWNGALAWVAAFVVYQGGSWLLS